MNCKIIIAQTDQIKTLNLKKFSVFLSSSLFQESYSIYNLFILHSKTFYTINIISSCLLYIL